MTDYNYKLIESCCCGAWLTVKGDTNTLARRQEAFHKQHKDHQNFAKNVVQPPITLNYQEKRGK